MLVSSAFFLGFGLSLLDDIMHCLTFFMSFSSFAQYNFKDRYDLVKFVKLVGESGLYLHLRIGPYICAEWNFGSRLFPYSS